MGRARYKLLRNEGHRQQLGGGGVTLAMRFVSIDLETTGADPWVHEVLEFAAIVYDTQYPVARADAPQFRVLMRPTFAQASPTALRMNAALVQELRAPAFDTVVLSEEGLVDGFADFLLQHGFRYHERGRIRVQVAGKNFDKFDRIFLERMASFRQKISFHRVALDPGLLYWNPTKDKQWIPNMVACKKRAGFADLTVAHRALDDAWDVVRLIQVYVDQ